MSITGKCQKQSPPGGYLYQKPMARNVLSGIPTIFVYISHRVWRYLWRWCKRRHPKKGKRWIYDKYFRTIKGVKWIFSCETKGRKDKKSLLTLFDIAKHPIIRHIKVKGTASPYDAELKGYWEDRSKKLGKTRWAKGSKYYQVAENQNWKCPTCRNILLNGEELSKPIT